MDVRIDELHSTVDLVTPQTLDQIVQAVQRALETERRDQQSLRSDLDTRSIVEQQRGGER